MAVDLGVHIDAPVQRVFDFFRDPGNWQQAGSGVTFREVHVTPEGTGTFYAWTTRVAGVPVEGFDVFTEFVPNQRIVDRSSLSFEGTWTYTFAPEGAGTRVQLRNQTGRLWRLPLVQRLADAAAVAGHRPMLARLKANLEADAEPDVMNATGSSDSFGFDTPAGHRGVKPSGRWGRWLSRQLDKPAIWRIGRGLYRELMGCDSLVLTTIGRRTGVQRTNRVAWFPGEDGSWLVVAAAGGTADNPAWYYNIAAHPAAVRIRVDGQLFDVMAEQLHGAERARAWRQVVATAPQFDRFQHKTDRVLPVIRLTPRVVDAGRSGEGIDHARCDERAGTFETVTYPGQLAADPRTR